MNKQEKRKNIGFKSMTVIQAVISIVLIGITVFVIATTWEKVAFEVQIQSKTYRTEMLTDHVNMGMYESMNSTMRVFKCYEEEFDIFHDISETYSTILSYTMWKKAVEQDQTNERYQVRADETFEKIMRMIETGKNGEFARVFHYFESLIE